MSLFNRVLVKLGIKKPIDYNSIEYLRSRGVVIGENVHIYNTNIDFGHGFLVSIGDNVTLTGTTILAHDASTQIPLHVSKVGKVTIGNNVFIGVGSIVLPNTTIGNNVIVGAGTVVVGKIPDNVVIAGNPYRVVESYEEFVEKHRKAMETKPVFDTFWKDKTDAQKKEMSEQLAHTSGYDV